MLTELVRTPLSFLLARVGRRALRKGGFQARSVSTPLGPIFAYDARGSGSLPPVAVIHGLGASATSFGPHMGRMLPHVRRIVAPDMPGHGFSGEATGTVTREALLDAMTAALDTLVEEPSFLVGNSLGGVVAAHYAIERPDRVRGLVLISPGGAQGNDDEVREVMTSFGFRTRAEAVEFLGKVFHRVPPILHLLAHELPASMSLRPAVSQIIGSWTARAPNPPEALAALRMPVLFIWGKSERLLPAAGLAWYREHLPKHAVIEEPEAVGHVPPARIAERILQFVRAHTT
jgi:pimeloyl-ACP methyl ester carboxylesterase